MNEQASIQLVLAACFDDLDSVQHALENGADVDFLYPLPQDQRPWTALHYASSNGHQEVVQFLLYAKADLFAIGTAEKKCAFGLAASNGHEALQRFLIRYCAEHYFSTYVRNNATQELRMHMPLGKLTLNHFEILLQDSPCWIQRKWDVGGLSVLQVACRTNAAIEIIRQLVLKRPEAVALLDSAGALPLHTACHAANSLEVIKFLVEEYPDALAKRNTAGDLPLHLLCQAHNPSVQTIMYLLERHGPAIQVPARDNRLPVIVASEGGSADVPAIYALLRQYPGALDDMKANSSSSNLPR